MCVCVCAMLNTTTLASMASSMAAAAHRSIGIQWKCISLTPLPCGLLTWNFITHETRVSSCSQSHHENRVCLIVRSLSLASHTLPHTMQHGKYIFYFVYMYIVHTHRPNILMDYYLHPLSWRSRSLACPHHSILFSSYIDSFFLFNLNRILMTL